MVILSYFLIGVIMALTLFYLGKGSMAKEVRDLKKENMNIRQENNKLYKELRDLQYNLKILGNDINAERSRVKDLLSVNEALGAEIKKLQEKNVVLVEHVNFLHSPKDNPIEINETQAKALAKSFKQSLRSEPKRKRAKPAKKKKNANKKA
jgi:cell division protein FtsB